MKPHAAAALLLQGLAAAAALWLAAATASGQACNQPADPPSPPPAETKPDVPPSPPPADGPAAATEPKSNPTSPSENDRSIAPRSLRQLDTESLLAELTPETADADLWAETMRRLGKNEERGQIQTFLSRLTPFPKAAFVALLRHDELSVRLGALEWLEAAAGRDFSYSPWVGPKSADPAQAEALAAWTAWAAGTEAVSAGTPKWSAERGESLIRDLLSGQRDREDRAHSQLEAYGLQAIAHLDAFGTTHPDLDSASHERIRAAKYRLALVDRVRDEAALLSRQLVFGHRDQQLASLSRLKSIGLTALPIVADYVRSPDALIRENAIDVFLSVGKAPALDAIRAELTAEPDKNVIHAILRQLGNLPTDPSRTLVRTWLGHADEDIVVEALGTLGKIGLDDVSLASRRSTSTHGLSIPSERSTRKVTVDVPAILGPHFKDARWRVRAAALECVARLGLADVADAARAALDDPDEFVRASAIQAAVSLRDTKAYPLLEKLFLSDPRMTGPVLGAFVSGGRPVPAALTGKLRERSAEAIMPAFASLDSSGEQALAILNELTAHPDADVSSSAWRLLAQNGSGEKNRALLARQLAEGPPERRLLILENLPSYAEWELRSARVNFYRAAAAPIESTVTVRDTGSSLDPLYRGFLTPLAQKLRANPTPAPTPDWDRLAKSGPWPEPKDDTPSPLVAPLESLLAQGTGQESQLAASCLLTVQSESGKAPQWLQEKFSALPVSTRVNIAERLGSPPHPAALPLLRLALADPASEVRSTALASAFGQEGAVGLIQTALREVTSPGSPVTGPELASDEFSELLRNASSRPILLDWSRRTLRGTSSDSLRILALAVLNSGWQDDDAELVQPQLKSPNPWLRRQAIVTLGLNARALLRPDAPTLAADPVPFIRAALATIYGSFRKGDDWQLRFSDTDSVKFTGASHRMAPLEAADLPILKSLASDSNADVRFEALFSLLAQDQPVDLRAFTALIPQLTPATAAADRLGSFLVEEYHRLPRPFAALLPHADLSHLEEHRVAELMDHFALDESHFLTFSTMAQAAGVDSTPVAAQPVSTVPEAKAADAPLKALFFFSPGCPECARVRELLARLRAEFPRLEVEEHSVAAADGLLLNQSLCLSQQVPARYQNVTPAVFTRAGYAIKENATSQTVRSLIQRTEYAEPDPDWPHFAASEKQAAQSAVENRLSRLTLGTVLGGGLLDGINPCAFATLIFFLSYLQIARRSRGEILAVGAAFVVAVFLTYFAIGLGLNQALGWLESFSWARRALNGVFAAFALVVAILSLLDAFKARRGDLAGMTLQLPGLLKGRIRDVIRSGSKSRRFILAAFGSGIVISVLELACTGQVYAPIVYAIRQGRGSAVGWLLLYNTAFILPLVALFLLAWSGMRSETLIRFQQKHTATVKFAFAALFFGLFLILVLAR